MKARSNGTQTSSQPSLQQQLRVTMVGINTIKNPNTTVVVQQLTPTKPTIRTVEQSSQTSATLPNMNAKSQRPSSPKESTSPPSGTLFTPIPNGIRRVSGENTIHTPIALSPSGIDTSSTTRPSQINRAPSPLSDSGNQQWSSAIGHATTTGKSGRVIERLMSENDRLKRELNEQLIKVEELQRTLQTYKPKIEALQAENENLSHTSSVDTALITRRDRKIDELKSELAAEKSRREATELRARAAERERDETLETTARDLQTLQESTRHATLHAEILETSHRQLGTEYRARVRAATKELETMRTDAAHDRALLKRLDVVADQMRTELERARRVQTDMLAKWEELDELSKQKLRAVVEETERENDRSRELSAQMVEVVDQMRWVMGLHRSRGGKEDEEGGE